MSIVVTQYPDDIQLIPYGEYNTGTGLTTFKAYDTNHQVLCFKLYAVVPIGNEEYERVLQFTRTSPGESGQQTKDATTYFRMRVSKTEGYNYITTINFSKVKAICLDRSVQYRTISGADNIQEYNSPQLSVEYRFLRECRFECDIYTSDDPTNIETVSFAVYWPTDSDDPRGNIKYQWYCSTDHGDTWFHVYYPPDVSPNNIYDSSIYKFPALSTYHGRQYKCKIYQERYPIADSYYTDPVRIDIYFQAPTIIWQPSSFELAPNSTKSMSIQADGSEISYQWQKNSANDWIDIEGAIKATYNVTATSEEAGNIDTYRCKVYNKDHTVYSNDIIVTILHLPPEIETDLQDQTTHEGDETTLSFTVNGQELSYQWYKYIGNTSTKIEGATLPAYTFTPTYADKNTKYYCIVSNDGGTVQTRVATLDVLHAIPVITIQPQNASVIIYNTARFAIEATGTNKKYQWEEKIARVWVPISGKTSTSFSVLANSTSMSGSEYHCIVTNDGGSVVSDTVTLTVTNVAPKITKEPSDLTVHENDDAEFTVTASGEQLDYQWYKKTNNTWTKIQGAAQNRYVFVASISDNHSIFKCIISNDGGEVSSREVTLIVQYAAPVITTDPIDATVYDNKMASFSVVASGEAKVYQWQKYVRNAWTNIDNTNVDTYTFKATLADDQTRYKCIVTNNGGSDESTAAMLYVLPGPIILTQPKSQSVYEKTSVTFSVSAKGESLTYQWQYQNGSNWIDITNENNPSYTFKATLANNGIYYRCVVENDSGTVESDEALLEVKHTPPSIKTQPLDQTVHENTSVTFSAVANGEALTYTWQKYTRNNWADIPDSNTPNYTFVSILADDNTRYQCIAENDGGRVTFNEVTLHVLNSPPSFIVQPKDKMVDENTNVTFAVEASGASVEYQWQSEVDGVWINISDANDKAYTFRAMLSDSGKKYKCLATNNGGTVSSNEVQLTVNARVLNKPVIITQPRDITVHENIEARFTIEVDDPYGITYQWQENVNDQWTNIYQANDPVYSLTPVIEDDQKVFRCEVKNNAYTIYSDEVTLSVKHTAPVITTQPLNNEVYENTTASFSIHAEGEELEYKWQTRIDNKWRDILNTNSDVYSFIATMDNDEAEYRCIVENDGGKATSLAASLNVKHAVPKISNRLQDQTVYENTVVEFSLEVIGDDVSYTWQKKVDGDWVEISGEKDATYSFNALYRFNGTLYRCQIENDGGKAISNEVYLTVLPNIPIITSPPADQLVTEGKVATFTISATGIDVRYRWKKKVNNVVSLIPDAKSDTYSFVATLEDNNTFYFCEAYNDGGSIASSEAKLMIKSTPPVIRNNPSNISVFENEDATLSIDADGDDLHYTWERKIDGIWREIENSDDRVYTFVASIEDNRIAYHCIVENNGGKVISESATITVKLAPPKILEQPTSLTVRVGEEAIFTIVATGNDIRYKWQKQSGGVWYSVATTETYRYAPITADYEKTYTYQCVITDSEGNSVTSDMFTLTVLEALPIITDQSSNQIVYTGDNIELFVKTEGKNIRYQWQMFNGIEWTDILDATKYIYIKENASDSDDNTRYKCKVENDAGYITSKEILITFCPSEPIILGQPTSITVLDGDEASFAVEATGKDIRYQWQSSIDQGTSWNDIINTNAAEYSFITSTSISGYQYRCIVTNSDDISVVSDPAMLTVNINNRYSLPVITTQPSSVTITEGESVNLTIDASDTSGSDLGYQWQIKIENTYYAITDATEPTYVIIGGVSMSGSIYRCVVSNPAGSVISNEVSVIVRSASAITMPTVVNQPMSIAVLTGTFSGFRLYATGGGLAYQWYRRNGGIWYPIPDATSPIYETMFTYEKEGSYRCEVTNVAGTVYSDTVTASIVEETNLDIYGYHSIFISGKNTYAEWEMYPTSRPHVASPEVKTNYVNLPGANGGFDYTELLIGEPTYGYRKGSWEFMLIPQERWAEVLRSLETYLHGRIHTVVLEDDLSYEYTGRLSVNKWESLQHNSTIVIDYTLEPVARNRGGETFNPDESDLQAATRILMKPEHANDVIALWHNTANIVNLNTYFEDGDDIAY